LAVLRRKKCQIPDLPQPKSGATVESSYKGEGLHCSSKGAITSKIKRAIKLKTSPARLAQVLQPSLAFCFSLQPMTAHWTVRHHWLQAKTMLMKAATLVQVLQDLF